MKKFLIIISIIGTLIAGIAYAAYPANLSSWVPGNVITSAWLNSIENLLGTGATVGSILVGSSTTQGFWLPVGTNGYILTASSTASHGLAWIPATQGSITINGLSTSTYTFATSGPVLTISASGNTLTWTLPTSTSAQTGVLSSGDWSTFNNKQSAITLNGTTNQINISSSSPAWTFSTPQDIATTSSPTFASGTFNGNINTTGYIRMTSTTMPTPTTNDTIFLHAHSNNGIVQAHVHSLFTQNSCDDLVGDNCVTVKNNSGGTLTIGQAVYVNGGGAANLFLVGLAQANSTTTALAVGLVATTSVANNGFFFAVQSGDLENVDTSAFNVGDPLYLSPTVAGGVTSTRPMYPNLVQRIGTVTRVHATQGEIQVDIAPAVLGRETGTISPTFSVGGYNAVTTSTAQQYIAPGTGISITTSTAGVSTINSSGVATTTGNWIGTWQNKNGSDYLSSSTQYVATTTGNWVGTFQSKNASDFLASSTQTEGMLPWSGIFSTSTNTYSDNFLGTMYTSSTIDRVDIASRDSNNTLTWNLLYGTDPTAATSTWFRVFTTDQTTTSTVGGATQLTPTASSTPGKAQFLVLWIYNASSSYTNWSVHYH